MPYFREDRVLIENLTAEQVKSATGLTNIFVDPEAENDAIYTMVNGRRLLTGLNVYQVLSAVSAGKSVDDVRRGDVRDVHFHDMWDERWAEIEKWREYEEMLAVTKCNLPQAEKANKAARLRERDRLLEEEFLRDVETLRHLVPGTERARYVSQQIRWKWNS